MTELEIQKLQKEIEKLKKENADLKKKKKFGLVWEEREREINIDDGEYYPYLVQKGEGFGFDNGDSNKNILIEGDNYHALEILQYTHKSKIDVIYIDPPYNTGKKNEFKYNDQWVDENDGYRHSKWLAFMSKRLRLAKSLLSKNGLIFISIDDNEQARLKLLCDDIFGENKFIGNIHWRRTESQNNNAKTFSIVGEHIIVFSKKMKTEVVLNKTELSEKALKEYRYSDSRGNFRRGTIIDKTRGKHKFDIILANGDKKTIKNSIRTEEWFLEHLKNDLIYFTKTFTPYSKIYLDDSEGMISSNWWDNKGVNEDAQDEMSSYALDFEFSKPRKLIETIIKISSNKDPLILDFFAGSGTTGHAVMELSSINRDFKNAKYITVTNNENNICEDITYQRLLKANKKHNYNSNLEYLKTELLKYDSSKHSDLDVKEFMVDKLTEIIKVRESCFELNVSTPFLSKFAHKDKSVYILHNIYNMKKSDYDEAIDVLNNDSNDNINIYILSISNHSHYMNKISKANKNITFEPLPENFLKMLRKLERKQK